MCARKCSEKKEEHGSKEMKEENEKRECKPYKRTVPKKNK
jgi:hypothetical protein